MSNYPKLLSLNFHSGSAPVTNLNSPWKANLAAFKSPSPSHASARWSLSPHFLHQQQTEVSLNSQFPCRSMQLHKKMLLLLRNATVLLPGNIQEGNVGPNTDRNCNWNSVSESLMRRGFLTYSYPLITALTSAFSNSCCIAPSRSREAFGSQKSTAGRGCWGTHSFH